MFFCVLQNSAILSWKINFQMWAFVTRTGFFIPAKEYNCCIVNSLLPGNFFDWRFVRVELFVDFFKF